MGRNWSRKSIEEIAKQVAKGIKPNYSITVRGSVEYGYPNLSNLDIHNIRWHEAYFMDIDMWSGHKKDTMYLPLPIFNGSLNPDGFINKGFFGESCEYDPLKGQLAFIFNDCSVPTLNPVDDDNFLYRDLYQNRDNWAAPDPPSRPSEHFRIGNYALKSPNDFCGWDIALYKATTVINKNNKGYDGIELKDVIYEKKNPKVTEFNVFRDSFYDYTSDLDSKFQRSAENQMHGYTLRSLKFVETPKTDDWKNYNISGTTYAFNSDFSESQAITGRGLPAATPAVLLDSATATHKIFVSGTLLNDLLFNNEYDVWSPNHNYINESAVLKITRHL